MIAAEIIRVIFALMAVIGLIGLGALALRKAGLLTASGGFVRKRRLALVETLALDARRRLAIIKCDGAEHLVILGPNSETLIAENLEGAPESAGAAPTAENPFHIFERFAAQRRPAQDADNRNAA